MLLNSRIEDERFLTKWKQVFQKFCYCHSQIFYFATLSDDLLAVNV